LRALPAADYAALQERAVAALQGEGLSPNWLTVPVVENRMLALREDLAPRAMLSLIGGTSTHGRAA
jgi:hypothetical protein